MRKFFKRLTKKQLAIFIAIIVVALAPSFFTYAYVKNMEVPYQTFTEYFDLANEYYDKYSNQVEFPKQITTIDDVKITISDDNSIFVTKNGIGVKTFKHGMDTTCIHYNDGEFAILFALIIGMIEALFISIFLDLYEFTKKQKKK